MISAIKRRDFIHKIFIIFIVLLAFYLRLDALGDGELRWDEAYSVWSANMDLHTITERTAADVHPPLHYWFFYLWVRLTGISGFAIRAQAALSSLMALAVVYSLTLRLSQCRRAATLALIMMALSPFHIEWSQDARMYAFVTLFAALALYAYWRGWQRLLVFAGMGAALSHYFGAFVIAIIILHRLLHWRTQRQDRRQFLTAIAVIGAACLLWLAFALPLIRRDASHATFQPVFTYKFMATLFAVDRDTYIDEHLPIVLPVTAVFFFGLFMAWRNNLRCATSLIVLGCLLPPAAISAVALPFFPIHVNFLSARYFIIFAPFVFAGFGISLAALLQRRRLQVVGIAVCIALLLLNAGLTAERRAERYFHDDYSSMMQAVAALAKHDERIFFTSGERKPYVYYYLDRAGYESEKDALAEPLTVTGIPNFGDDVPAMMQWVFSGFPRFWLIQIDADKDLPRGARLDWINTHYHRIYHIPVNGHNGISLYSIDPTDSPPQSSVFIPPVITEARPGDFVRIGVPAGTRVDLVHSGQIIDTRLAETWMLHQFDIYAFYFNGYYELRVGDESYPFVITHSQDFPGGT